MEVATKPSNNIIIVLLKPSSIRRVNLCRVSRDELRARLTLSNLKGVCLKYRIQGVSGNRKEEPYVNALFSFIEARPCSLHKGLP